MDDTLPPLLKRNNDYSSALITYNHFFTFSKIEAGFKEILVISNLKYRDF